MKHPKYTGPVVDAHAHFDSGSAEQAQHVLDEVGLTTLINLWDLSIPPLPFEEWTTPWRAMKSLALCHVPDLSPVGTRDFAVHLVDGIRNAADMGAVGIKVWKDLGLWLRDEQDERVGVDDERLRILWEAAAEADLPIVIHVGDPPGFFSAFTPDNERYKELLQHPEWWFGSADYPDLETIHDEFESMVASNRKTTFIGAHFGCFMPFKRVSYMLDQYDNYFVDTSARIADLGRDTEEDIRRIFNTYTDRIIFGTDLIRTADFDMPDNRLKHGDVSGFYDLHWRFFETNETNLPHPLKFQGDWTVTGLGLDRDALELLYRRNAERLFHLDASK